MARPLYLPESGPVASLARVVGDVQMDAGDGHWTPLAAGSVVKAGAVIRTGSNGRAAIAMKNGVELRLDSGTQLAFNDDERCEPVAGRRVRGLGPGRRRAGSGFRARDAGRQRASPRHAVRGAAGRRRAAGRRSRGPRRSRVARMAPCSAAPAKSLTVSDTRRDPLAAGADGSAWKWVNGVTPPFSIEGRSVDEFLTWAGPRDRSQGRLLVAGRGAPGAERHAARHGRGAGARPGRRGSAGDDLVATRRRGRADQDRRGWRGDPEGIRSRLARSALGYYRQARAVRGFLRQPMPVPLEPQDPAKPAPLHAGASRHAGRRLLWSAAASAGPPYAGRPLDDVLDDLGQQGLHLVYSSETVPPRSR